MGFVVVFGGGLVTYVILLGIFELLFGSSMTDEEYKRWADKEF